MKATWLSQRSAERRTCMSDMDTIIDDLISSIAEVDAAEALHNDKRLELRSALASLDLTLRG